MLLTDKDHSPSLATCLHCIRACCTCSEATQKCQYTAVRLPAQHHSGNMRTNRWLKPQRKVVIRCTQPAGSEPNNRASPKGHESGIQPDSKNVSLRKLTQGQTACSQASWPRCPWKTDLICVVFKNTFKSVLNSLFWKRHYNRDLSAFSV